MMLFSHLRNGLLLNRTLGVLLVYYALLFIATDMNLIMPYLAGHRINSPIIDQVSDFMLLIVAVTGLIGGELILKRLKKRHINNNDKLEKWSVTFPILAALHLTLAYVISGSVMIGFYLLVPVLQAHFFGNTRLAKLLFGWACAIWVSSALLSIGVPWIGRTERIVSPVLWMLEFLPFPILLFQYGRIVCGSVRTITSQVNRLHSMATTDALTGLVNRRQFNTRLQGELARAVRYHCPLSLALFDIDDFKKLNDFFGHQTGDRVLKELGALIESNIRENDIAARYGGEEFALILPQTSLHEASEVLERLRQLIERQVFCLPENPITLTVSIGVAELDAEHATSFDLVERADSLLYEAKRQGKNRVASAFPERVLSSLPMPGAS